MKSWINMLRCSTSHDIDAKTDFNQKRVPVPKDKSPQTDVLNNSFLLVLLQKSDIRL